MGEIERIPEQTMKIGTKDYPITGYVKSKKHGVVPMVDIPMMSDYKWQLQSLQSRLENPELYRRVLGEDVEAVIAQLRKWLEEHSDEEEAITWVS